MKTKNFLVDLIKKQWTGKKFYILDRVGVFRRILKDYSKILGRCRILKKNYRKFVENYSNIIYLWNYSKIIGYLWNDSKVEEYFGKIIANLKLIGIL